MPEENYQIQQIFAYNVKKIRKAKGLSQYRLSKIANVSHALLNQLERGSLDITIAKASRISKALDVKLSKFFVLPKGYTKQKLVDSFKDPVADMLDYREDSTFARERKDRLIARKVLSYDRWKHSIYARDTNRSDDDYQYYLDNMIDLKKDKLIKSIIDNQNPKDLEYSFEENLEELKDSGEYYEILNKNNFLISNNPNKKDYQNFEYAYFTWDKHIEERIDEIFKEAYEQSKAEYKSATIDKSLDLPKDDEPEEA